MFMKLTEDRKKELLSKLFWDKNIDIADILFIAQRYEFNWEDVFEEAKRKDLWVDPLEICKIIKELPSELFHNIKWISPVNAYYIFLTSVLVCVCLWLIIHSPSSMSYVP